MQRSRHVAWSVGLGSIIGTAAAVGMPLSDSVQDATKPAAQRSAEVLPDATPQDGNHDLMVVDAMQAFQVTYPGASVSRNEDGRIARVFGSPFGSGASPEQAAQTFVNANAGVWGVSAQDLAPVGPFQNGQHVTPMMYDQRTDSYRFTGVHYTQQRDGVPVFRGRLTLLARNDAQFPLVLASSDIRPIGDFAVGAAPALPDEAVLRQRIAKRFRTECEISDVHHVIWAGTDDHHPEPGLGVHYVAEYFGPVGHVKWLIIDDARTGCELYRENQVLHAEIQGTVTAMATEDIGASACSGTIEVPLPYASVFVGGQEVFTDENGYYLVQVTPDGVPVPVISGINGRYFDVQNSAGDETEQSTTGTPPDVVDFLHDPATAPIVEHAQAEVDAYVHANLVRDFALSVNPSYPVIDDQIDFTINVNIDANCNATYSGNAINFYTSGGGCNNTAFDSVVYHEYGHHLVNTGGSGQGQYGEGMSDTVALLITDDPALGRGFSSCGNGIRSADNNLQYPCSGGIHFCGQLISGCVWSLRDELISTEPADWHDILSDLTINSILLHTGTLITPQITIDFLTLDDDNGNIYDGTPHFDEIMTAFADEHSMTPELDAIAFNFPDGLPESIHPVTGATFTVEVLADNDTPTPGTGVIHIDTGSGFVPMPMTETSPNIYEAVIPAVDCVEAVSFYFSADSALPYTQVFPTGGAASAFQVTSATDIATNFTDDFEADLGWSVTNDAALTDGAWARSLPLGGGLRADPAVDADGSGQCFLTNPGAGNTDVDGGTTILTSPTLDATGSNVIAYWLWYSNATGDAPQQDIFLVEVSDDDGASWQLLEQVGPSGPEVFGGWRNRQMSLVDLVDFDINDQFRIRFTASDTDPQSLVEAAIDGVRLLDIQCAPVVPGDFTGDGLVGLADLLAIIGGWGPCDPLPCGLDSDGDGVVGLNELLEVIGNWGG